MWMYARPIDMLRSDGWLCSRRQLTLLLQAATIARVSAKRDVVFKVLEGCQDHHAILGRDFLSRMGNIQTAHQVTNGS